jgi:5-methylcytosine-specific restriction endonuclease McrA
MSSKIPEDVKARVRSAARHRCGYCQAQQRYTLLVIEHIIAKARGGADDERNLWLACRLCNNGKGIQTHARDPITGRQVKLFNPRTQSWRRHFKWAKMGLKSLAEQPSDALRSSH